MSGEHMRQFISNFILILTKLGSSICLSLKFQFREFLMKTEYFDDFGEFFKKPDFFETTVAFFRIIRFG